MPPPQTKQVFISHAKKDRTIAQALCKSLEEAGISCWIDHRDMPGGAPWGKEIVQAIQSCRLFLLLGSPNANASENVQKEVMLAHNAALPVMPVRLEDVQPQGSIEFVVSGLHMFDLFPEPHTKFPEVVDIIQKMLSQGNDPAVSARLSDRKFQASQAHTMDMTAPARIIRRRWIVFWVFLVPFILLVLATVHSSLINPSATPEEHSLLIKLLILEVGASIVALCYNVFSLKNEKQALLAPHAVAGGSAGEVRKFAISNENKHRFELSAQPERFFTSVAVIFASLSAAITLGNMFGVSLTPWAFVLNNFLIFTVLLILTLFFFLRYRQMLADYAMQGKNYQDNFELLNRLISDQSGFYHDVMRDTRETFFIEFGDGIYPYRFNYQNQKLRGTMERSVEKVVAILMKMITNQFQMRDIDEKISLSVKVQVTGAMAKNLCELEVKSLQALNDEELYIITLARDHETETLFTEREVRKEAYLVADNTDFSSIRAGAPVFLSNDLSKLESGGHYVNNNQRWKTWYNATLVTPIAHRAHPDGKPNIYGFLTVDSLNKSRKELFTRDGVEPIMAFGADLLALIFLNLEVFDNKTPVNGGANGSPPRGEEPLRPDA